jgi:hypothetical protein
VEGFTPSPGENSKKKNSIPAIPLYKREAEEVCTFSKNVADVCHWIG